MLFLTHDTLNHPQAYSHPQILWQALPAFQLAALLSLVWIATTNTPPDATSGIAVASWFLSLASSLLLLLVSRLEHSKSRPPSALLQTFLLVTIVLDAARFRTAWFSAGGPVHDEARQLLPVQLIIKTLLLIAESGSKAAVIAIPARRISREEASGIFGTAFALWILPLLSSGWRKDLTVDDLEPVDEALSSERVLDKLTSAWQRGSFSFSPPHFDTVQVADRSLTKTHQRIRTAVTLSRWPSSRHSGLRSSSSTSRASPSSPSASCSRCWYIRRSSTSRTTTKTEPTPPSAPGSSPPSP